MEIKTIEILGPKQVGPANTYLLKGERNILIDTGPCKEDTFDALKSGLSKHGVELEDLDLVIITHPHSDHFGNASKIRQKSGAKIAIHKSAAPIVENYEEHIEKQNQRAEDYFSQNGVPRDENKDLVKLAVPDYSNISTKVDQRLEDGDKIQNGEETLNVLHTSGHTPGSISLVAEKKGLVFVGDTVLGDITPNPMLHVTNSIKPISSLENYLNSLERLKELKIGKFMPGHGEPIKSPVERIDEIFNHHQERKEKVLKIAEGRNAFEVMKELFPGLPRNKYFFGMSEAVGHLELLVSEEKLEKKGEEEVIYCRV